MTRGADGVARGTGRRAITVLVGGCDSGPVPVSGHPDAAVIARRLARIAGIMAHAVDVLPHPDEATWSMIVSTADDGSRPPDGMPTTAPAAVVAPHHVSGPVGSRIPPTASWVISPIVQNEHDQWRSARCPFVRRRDRDGNPFLHDEGGSRMPGDALRIVLPGFGAGPVMVHPSPPVLRECARFAALAADAFAGNGTLLTADQWDLVIAAAAFGADATPARRTGVEHGLVHNAGHPLRAERLVLVEDDINAAIPRHATRDLTPPGAPQAMLLSLGIDPFVPTLEPVDTADRDPRDEDPMAILRAIEAMRAATGWAPTGRAEP